MRYLQAHFVDLTQEMQELMVAMLPEFGFSGMQEDENALVAYAKEDEGQLDALRHFADGLSLSFKVSHVEEQNWNALWESNFEPVIIPGKVHVRASFHPAIQGIEHEILITPKMSFGTGHHATTRMMLKAMLSMNFQSKQVIDFGTGTGILAIFAEKLGASTVEAIDNDAWSVNNALENVGLNSCDAVEVTMASSLSHNNPCDVLLANINRHVLEEHVSDIQSKVRKNGLLLISGLLKTDYADMVSLYGGYFGAPVANFEDNGWIALLFQC